MEQHLFVGKEFKNNLSASSNLSERYRNKEVRPINKLLLTFIKLYLESVNSNWQLSHFVTFSLA